MNMLSLCLSVGGVVLGALGTFATLWLGWLALKRRKLVYDVAGSVVASSLVNEVDGLRLMHSRKRIDRATVSNVCLWNSGRGTVQQDDLALKEPLMVQVPEGASILSCEIVRASRPVVNASIIPTGDLNTNQIAFEFLSHKDWLHIRVLHTAYRPQDCKLVGTLKEGREHVHRANMRYSRKRFLWILVALIPSSLLLSVALSAWLVYNSRHVARDFAKTGQDLMVLQYAIGGVDAYERLGTASPAIRNQLRTEVEKLRPEYKRKDEEFRKAGKRYFNSLVGSLKKSFLLFSLPLGYGLFVGTRLWLLYRIPARVLYTEESERKTVIQRIASAIKGHIGGH